MRFTFALGLTALLVPVAVKSQVEIGRILVKNGIVFTLKADETAPQRGYLLAGEDGKILRVGYGDPPPGIRASQVLDATGKFVMPGFVSAHNHIYQTVMRGLAADQALGGWLDAIRPYRTEGPLEDRYWRDSPGGMFRPPSPRNHDGIQLQRRGRQKGIDVQGLSAELASGMRFVHGYCLPVRGTRESRSADFEEFYAYTRRYTRRQTFLALALGGYSCIAPDKDYAMLEGEIMAKYGFHNEAHYLEPAAPEQVMAQRGRACWFADSGELGPKLSFGHLVHADDVILGKIAAAGAGMVWNPLSNGRLASGTPDIPKIMHLGIRIGMGVDGQASADIADPFENMRSGLYVIRARNEDPTALQPRDVLRFHTLGSADVIAVTLTVGSLEKGKFADFLIVDPHLMETGPVYDPYGSLVLACGTPNIERVYVGAHLIVDHGNCVNPDLQQYVN